MVGALASNAHAARVICISRSGKLTVGTSCKSPNRRFYLTSLASTGDRGLQGNRGVQGPQGVGGAQGPQGPQGNDGARGPAGTPGSINLSTCHSVSASLAATNGAASVTPSCDSKTEMLRNWGYFYDPVDTKAVLRTSYFNYLGEIPYAVTITTQFKNQGNPPTNYTLYGTAVCCSGLIGSSPSRPMPDPAAVVRGKAIYQSGCTGARCHSPAEHQGISAGFIVSSGEDRGLAGQAMTDVVDYLATNPE